MNQNSTYLKLSFFLIFFASLILSSCKEKGELEEDSNSIKIGNYIIESGLYELKKEQGIDSYVGKLVGPELSFNFDYGYYSNSLINSKFEYIQNLSWVFPNQKEFQNIGIDYDSLFKIKYSDFSIQPDLKDSLDGNYIAVLNDDTSKTEFKINIPNKIKNASITIDTVQNHFRKIVIQDNGEIGLYFKDLDSYSSSINSYLALSISTQVKTENEKAEAIQFLKSIKPN